MTPPSEPRPYAWPVKVARPRPQRALNIDPKRLYKWQKEALTPVAAARGAELDPATAAELRQLRAANRRQAQELEILKKAIAIFSQTPDQ
jgi:transposase